MKQITEVAYAKINLGLDILGRREDGYHEVSMIMQSIGRLSSVPAAVREKLNFPPIFPG